jgi:hypothetical protein
MNAQFTDILPDGIQVQRGSLSAQLIPSIHAFNKIGTKVSDVVRIIAEL